MKPRWNRWDICEAWLCLAHDYGLYGIVARLRRMRYSAPGARTETLESNARAIYEAGEKKAFRTSLDPWSRKIK